MVHPHLTDALGHAPADKRIDILRAIAATGSISQAARDVGVSYKAAWQAIDTLTNLAGVLLVERAVGGAGGGGAALTADGLELLELADALQQARAAVQNRWRETSAAGVDQTVARLALRTSMRNQLPARLSAMEATGSVVRLTLQLGAGATLAARITRESQELLGLAVGMTVIALCKATCVRVVRGVSEEPVTEPACDGRNRLSGSVSVIERGPDGDEVVLALRGGGQLVGFAAARSGLRVRQRAIAQVDEASVVVALPG